MPFIKKGLAAQVVTEAKARDEVSVINPVLRGAIEPSKLSTAVVKHDAPKGRDFDAEARGKTRCALEEAWAQSPLLPMLVKDPNDRAELHLILDEIVTERMTRVFPNG